MSIFEFVRGASCAAMVGIAIKLMDDHLDYIEDQRAGQRNLSFILGRGLLPYALWALAVAAMLDHSTALSLFTAAYVLGMARDSGQSYPSGLGPLPESMLAIAVGLTFLGLHAMASALLFIGLVQVVDDIADSRRDRGVGRSNLVRRFGGLECTVAAAILAVLLVAIDIELLVAGLTAYVVIEAGLRTMVPALSERGGVNHG